MTDTAPRKIKGVLIDVWNETAEITTLDADLDAYYAALNCTTIAITSRRIGPRGRKYYDIICDDEGLLVAPTKISAVDSMGRPQLVGNLFICYHDKDGNEISLTDTEAKRIMREVHITPTRAYPHGYPMLHNVKYT